MKKQLVFKTRDERFNIYKASHPLSGDPIIIVNGCVFDYYQKPNSLVQFLQNIQLSDEITKPTSRKIENTDDLIVDLDYEYTFKIRPKTKEYFRAASDILGVSPSVYLKAFNFHMYDHMVARFDNHHVKKLCFKYPAKKLCPVKVRELNNISVNLDQLKKDNLYHLAPIVFKLRKDPADLKKEFGKGAWKKITKNTFSRNKLLMNVPTRNTETIVDFNTLPSSLIQYVDMSVPKFLKWAQEKMKGKWSNKKEIEKAYHLFIDTERMANNIGETFNLNWTHEEMKAAHDRYIPQLISGALKADNKVFDHYDSVPVKTYIQGDFEATYLKTVDEIHLEGKRMHHCVGGYAGLAKCNEYAVYHITFKGEKYSTLGLVVNKNLVNNKLTYNLSQHYEACNQPVSIEADFFSQELIELLNKPVDKLAKPATI